MMEGRFCPISSVYMWQVEVSNKQIKCKKVSAMRKSGFPSYSLLSRFISQHTTSHLQRTSQEEDDIKSCLTPFMVEALVRDEACKSYH
jgi:hypothetical protein